MSAEDSPIEPPINLESASDEFDSPPFPAPPVLGHPSSVKAIFQLWLPLAISFQLMMLEGPVFQGAMGRLANPSLNLAAWGLAMSLSLLIESPVIMLLATAIALVKDRDSYAALRRFAVTLVLGCTLVTALVAFTPVFDLIAGVLMGQPAPIVAAARPAMRIMLLWSAAIGWRRFLQGVLVRHGYTRLVSVGTAIRLAAAVSTAVGLVAWGHLPGAQVAAVSIMIAVVTEALVTTGFALPVIARELPDSTDDGRRMTEDGNAKCKVQSAKCKLNTHESESVTRHPSSVTRPLTQRAIFRFHAPLAATTVMTLLAQPMTSAALARLPNPRATLAAWPVAFMVLLVIRGGGFALQEITVAQARYPSARRPLLEFAWWLGAAATGFTAVVAAGPLLNVYLNGTLHLPPGLHPLVLAGVAGGVMLPLLTALASWARGLLVLSGATHHVYKGMGIGLATQGLMLIAGVWLSFPGMWLASLALTLACLAEYTYLVRRGGSTTVDG